MKQLHEHNQAMAIFTSKTHSSPSLKHKKQQKASNKYKYQLRASINSSKADTYKGVNPMSSERATFDMRVGNNKLEVFTPDARLRRCNKCLQCSRGAAVSTSPLDGSVNIQVLRMPLLHFCGHRCTGPRQFIKLVCEQFCVF